MPLPEQFGFYAILTNPLRGYDYCTKVLVDAGVAVVQLRIKDSPPEKILPVAEKMRSITEGSTTLFIINDFPELVLQCDADGVHIGQDDRSYDSVRKLLGPDKIIGISTHSPEQTVTACASTPDYIGMGPVYPTPTKKIPDPAIGLTGLKKMLTTATVPGVAIGGIDCENLPKVLETGAVNFCMVRQFTQSKHPEKVITSINSIYKDFYPLF